MSNALTNFGAYVLLGELGAGAMGVVFQARHVATNRTVALKVLRAAGHASPELLRRFRVEAEAVATLEHPNIVPFYDVGEHDGQFYLSMKLVPGGTLAEAVAEAGPLAPKRAAGLLAKIARAVEHAHQRGVLHRDLKPGNILLNDNGEPYLTDFGLAKVFSHAKDLTLSHALLGTPAYMAPEVAEEGAQAATIAADIYSLGAVLYQSLTGRPPFTGESPLQVLDQVRRETPPAPRSLVSTILRDLEIICLKCLSREPSLRYATAMELAEDLERFARGEPISVRQPSVAATFAWWVRRHKVVAGFTAALLVTLGFGLFATAWQWRRAEQFLAKTRATNRLLTEQLLWRDQREVEALLANRDTHEAALKQLARHVRDHPDNSLPTTRLFSALAQRSWLWPVTPPLAHETAVSQGAFTPDGRLVLIASKDGFLHVWKVVSGERVFKLPHDTGRGRFAISPDGRQVATLGSNGTAQIWQMPGGQLIQPALKLRTNICVLAFSPDGQKLATADTSGLACFWRVADGQLLGSFNHGQTIQFLFFPSNGTSLITLGRVGKRWRLTDKPGYHSHEDPAASPAGTIELDAPAVHAELSPGGDRLLTVVGKYVYVWNAQTTTRLSAVPFNSPVNFASFSPDGFYFCSGNEEFRANIRNAATGNPRLTSMMHSGAVNTTRYHPNGQWIVTASRDGATRIWATARNLRIAQSVTPRGEVRDALFSPDGKYLLELSSGGIARLWAAPVPLADEVMLPLPEGETIYALSSNSKLLAAACADNVVSILSNSTVPKVIASMRHSAPITALIFGPDNRRVAAADESGLVSICSVGSPSAGPGQSARDESIVRQFHLGEPIRKLEWSPSGQHLGAVLSNQVCLLNTASACTNDYVFVSQPMVCSLDYSPDGSRLVVAGDAKTRASVFDSRTGQWLFDSRVHPGPVVTVRFSPNGRTIASGSAENSVSVWDAATGRAVIPLLHPGADPTCLAFSPDSLTLLTGLANGAVRTWDVTQGRLKQDLLRHRQAVLAGEFSPDGNWVATSSEDRYVRLTHVASALPGMEVSEPVVRPFVRFSQDGNRLLVEPDRSPPRTLKMPAAFRPKPEVLVALAELILGQQLNAQGGWEELSREGFRARCKIMQETFQRPNPHTQVRFFRHPAAKRQGDMLNSTTADLDSE